MMTAFLGKERIANPFEPDAPLVEFPVQPKQNKFAQRFRHELLADDRVNQVTSSAGGFKPSLIPR